MCRIAGYIGTKSIYPILNGGLKRAGYREYGSVVIALNSLFFLGYVFSHFNDIA